MLTEPGIWPLKMRRGFGYSSVRFCLKASALWNGPNGVSDFRYGCPFGAFRHRFKRIATGFRYRGLPRGERRAIRAARRVASAA